MLSPYLSILSIPGARAFAGWGMLARLQMGLTGLATFLLVQMEYGSYAAGGTVLATIALSYVAIAPQVAKLVDRYGQAKVLRWGYAVAIAGRIGMLVAVFTSQPLWVLLALAPTFAAGGSQSTLTRARWTHVVKNRDQLNTAFSLESSLEEVLFIMGPALATILATQVASWLPSVIAMVTLAVGGYMFLSLKDTEPPVRRRSADAGAVEAALSLSPSSPAVAVALPGVDTSAVRRVHRRRITGRVGVVRRMRRASKPLLIASPVLAITTLVFMTQGMMFASVDASTVAFAEESGQKSMSGIVLAVWAFGSLVGGLAYGAKVWNRTLATRLFWGVTVTGVGVTLFMFAPSLLLLSALMFITGLAIAPTMVIGDSLVHAMVPRSRMTEGMSWTRTGIDMGVAIGAWSAGVLIDRSGSTGGFAVTAAAGLLGMIIVAVSWRYIRRQPRFEEVGGLRDAEVNHAELLPTHDADAPAHSADVNSTGAHAADAADTTRAVRA